MELENLKWDPGGLVTVVVQDRFTGEVRMVAHANREAVRRTRESGDAWFWSRSRAELWRKGATSENTVRVVEVREDCDADALLYLSEPSGPSCHTGKRSCFSPAAPGMVALWDELEARREAPAAKSYTRSLLDGGPAKIAAKVREESDELARALESETDERVVSEAADVVYHAMVGLLARGKTWRDVEVELQRRRGTSGIEEKASRG